MATNTTSFSNTPQAKDDVYNDTGLTEDNWWTLGPITLDVMANDLGGNAKTLYSIDNGLEDDALLGSADLLVKDVVGAPDYSLNGATIKITVEGKVSYDASTFSGAFQAQLQALPAGQYLEDTFTYAIRLGNGTLSWATVTVRIAGLNDVPTISGVSAGAVTEDTGVNGVGNLLTSGTLTIVDVDTGQSSFVSQAATTGSNGYGTFSINAAGNWTYTAGNEQGAIQALGAGQSLTDSFTVWSYDGSKSQVVTVTIHGTNDAPVITSGVAARVDENAATDTVIYTATRTDVDAGDSVTWSLTGTDAAAFTIDASGNVRLNASANYEAKASYSINVVATDGAGLTDTKAVAISVNDVNEAPTVTSGPSGSVDENAAPSTVVYAAAASDPDAGDSATWSLSGTDAGAFSVDTSGNVRLNVSANFEAKASYSINVVATDSGGLTDTKPVTISVNNLDEVAPTITSAATADAIYENSGAGQLVYTATSTDTGDIATGTTVYSLKAVDDHAAFSIDASTGEVTLLGDPNYEGKSSYSFTVVATDAAGNASEQVDSRGINNLDEVAPTITSDATADAIDENSGAGQLVYTATSTDTDDIATGSTTYSLKAGSDAGLSIDGVSGAVTLTGNPDFETKASYSFTVLATDAAGNASEQVVSLGINNVNEAPTITTGAIGSVDENAATSTIIYTAIRTDVDAGDTVTWTLTGADAALLSINAAGEVRLLNSADFESKASYSFNVVATDGGNLSDTKAVVVSVNDFNDAPTITSDGTGSVDENAATGTIIYTAIRTDVDAGDTVTWSLTGTDASLLSINAAGEVRLLASPDFETKASYSFNVVATDGGSLSDTKAVVVSVNDVNEAPTAVVLSNTVTNIDENTSTASRIKVADIAITDDALGTNTLSLSGADKLNFEIVGSVLYLKAGVTLDYESKISYAVNVDVDDATVGGSPDASQSFTLNVNDLPEGVAATDLRLVVDTFVTGNSLPSGNFAHFAVTDPDGGGAHSFSMTATSNNGASPASVLTLSSAGVLSAGAGLAQNTVYTLNVTTTQAGASPYTEAFYITTGTNADNGSLTGLGDDVIYGLGGSDIVLAGSGDDTVFGGQGNDHIHGGDGNDVLHGGGGNDTFYFNTPLNATTNVDTIKDFESGSDKISLLKLGLFSNLAGSAGATTLGTDFNTVSQTGGHIVYDGSTGNLYYDADGGSHTLSGPGMDSILFANLTNVNGTTHPTIVASDFVIG